MGCFVWCWRQARESRWRGFLAFAGALLLPGIPTVLGAEEEPSTQPTLSALFGKSVEEVLAMPIPSVGGASKWEQPITQAPSAVTVVTADEIKKYGHRTLADVLRSVRGLHVTYDRNYDFLGVRGFNRGDFNNRVLVLVDGHRLNNNLSDGGPIGTDFILDVDLIQQVEVVRGPVATLYGNNAFFGIINVITRRGRDFHGVGAEVSADAGSFDTYRGRVTWGHLFGPSVEDGVEVLLSGSLYDSEGQEDLYFKEFDAPQTNNGIAEHADDDTFKSGFATVRWRDFTVQTAYITREKVNPTAQYETAFNDARLRTTDDRGYVNLTFDHDFPDVFELTARLYYDWYDFTRGQPAGLEDGSPTDLPLNKEVQAGQWWGSELQFTRQIFDRHTLSLGGEYRDDFQQMWENYFEGAPELGGGSANQTTFNYGIFLQGDFLVLTNMDNNLHTLHLNAGVRYDQYGENDPAFNPRVALIYNPVPSAALKAIYGSAFRAPNFFERTYNPDLSPETIDSAELVYEQGIGKHLRSTALVFFSRTDDLISLYTDADLNTTYQNIEGAEALGAGFELEGEWADVLRGRVSYSYQDARDRADDSRLTDSPEHLVKFNLSVPVWKKKLFADLEAQYTSERRAAGGDEAGGFGIINFTLFSQNLVKHLEVSASVYNLLDCEYDDPATLFHQQTLIEQDGRTFRVKLTYHF